MEDTAAVTLALACFRPQRLSGQPLFMFLQTKLHERNLDELMTLFICWGKLDESSKMLDLATIQLIEGYVIFSLYG